MLLWEVYVRFTRWALNDPSMTSILNVLCICCTDIAVCTSCEVSCLVEPCGSHLVSRSEFSVDRHLIQLKPCSDATYVRLFFFFLSWHLSQAQWDCLLVPLSVGLPPRDIVINDSVTCVVNVYNELMWDIPLCLKYVWVKCRGTSILSNFINKTNYTLFCVL